MIESGFAPDAYSCARAAGPWQFMPQTAKGFSLRIDPWIDERRDPVKSTVAAAMYLKELYVLFDQDWYLAAAGYNAGENKVLRAIRRYKSRDFWKLAERSYLKRETRDYVPKLLAAAIIAKEPAKYGFADVAYLTPIEFDTVTIPEQTDLEVVARLCNVSEETIRELNPEILLWCTPPNSDNYELKIPKGSRQAFLDAYGQLSPGERYSERLIFSRYRVKRGESLKSLARKFGTTTRQLADINGLTRRKRLTGTTILVPISIANLEAVTIGTGKEGGRRAYVRAHIVSKGESLKGLARRYNVSPKTLAAWNGLSLAKPLKPGKRLIVVRYVAASGSLVYERQGS
jgi:membrane-bound lytic murein transglycosylase D